MLLLLFFHAAVPAAPRRVCGLVACHREYTLGAARREAANAAAHRAYNLGAKYPCCGEGD